MRPQGLMATQSFDIEGPDFELVLSDWDRRFPPIYSKRILCFSLSDLSSKEYVVSILHDALRALVQDLPFLAGSIVPYPRDEGGTPWLRSISSLGAARLIVKDRSPQIKWSDLRKCQFCKSLPAADELVPTARVVDLSNESMDVCRIQANFVEGGLLLVASIIHCVCDGVGITEVLKTYAQKIHDAFSNPPNKVEAAAQPIARDSEASESNRTRTMSYDRSLILNSGGLQGAIENHTAWTTSPVNAHSRLPTQSVICRTFSIGPDALSRLKQVASRPSTTTTASWISTHDAIVSLIWRTVVRARERVGIFPGHKAQKQDDNVTYLTQAIDCRARLGLPSPYHGNAIYSTRLGLLFNALTDADHGLATAAHAIRAELSTVTGAMFQDLLGFVHRTQMEAHTKLKAVEELSDTGVFVTSYWGMDMYGLDFGGPLGQIEAFRLPAEAIVAGMHVILPRNRDGSCEIVISEAEATVEQIRNDELFLSFAKELA